MVHSTHQLFNPKPKPDQFTLEMDIFNIKDTLTWQNKGLIKQKYHIHAAPGKKKIRKIEIMKAKKLVFVLLSGAQRIEIYNKLYLFNYLFDYFFN